MKYFIGPIIDARHLFLVIIVFIDCFTKYVHIYVYEDYKSNTPVTRLYG